MKILALALLPTIAYAGNGGSDLGNSSVEMGLGGSWRVELSGEKNEEAVENILFAKAYNMCMERADAKNTADHNRCDKTKGGDPCHDKADSQYDANRNSCERVAHSDNLKDTGTPDGNGSFHHRD